MQKWSSKSKSMQKTEQNRSSWKFLTMVKVNGQSQRSTDDVCWRGSVTSPRADVAGKEAQQARVAREWAWTGAWGVWQVPTARGGVWSTCSWGRNFSWRMKARVMQFLAVLGWVLLGISCSVFLYLFFGSWMHTTLISECCRYFGRDGGSSLLTVTTGWWRG